MKAALIQMRTVSDKAENLRHARELIDEAAKNGADLCVLPEMFCCEYRNRSFIENQEPAGRPGLADALRRGAGEPRLAYRRLRARGRGRQALQHLLCL